MSFADDMLDRLGTFATQDPDGITAAVCRAGGAMLGDQYEIVQDSDDGPGYSQLLDPARTPADWLGWTAAVYGVTLVRGAPEEVQREQISALPPEREGRPSAIVSAARATLSDPDGTVRVLERPGDAYSVTVITRASQTPDTATTEAAIRSQKPIGVSLSYEATDLPVIDEITRRIDDITVAIDDLTITDVT